MEINFKKIKIITISLIIIFKNNFMLNFDNLTNNIYLLKINLKNAFFFS